MADGDHELRAGEDVHLAELDGLGLVDVAGRAQDAEQGVAVALELGPLVRVDRVLDRELVQRELARDLGELLARRAVEADPGDPAAVAAGRSHVREVLRLGDPLAVAVDGTGDDHACNLRAVADGVTKAVASVSLPATSLGSWVTSGGSNA